MNKDKLQQKLYDYFISKKADKFWINIALKHILLSLNGNGYWINDMVKPRCSIDKFGMIKKFTCIASCNTTQRSFNVTYIYIHTDRHIVTIKE